MHSKAWQWWRCTSFSTGVRIKTYASSHWRMIVKGYFCKRPQFRWRSRIRSTWFVTQSSSNGEDCITYRTLTSFQELTRASGGFLTVGGPAPCTFCTPGMEKSAIWLFRMIPESVIIPEPKYPLIVLDKNTRQKYLSARFSRSFSLSCRHLVLV